MPDIIFDIVLFLAVVGVSLVASAVIAWIVDKTLPASF